MAGGGKREETTLCFCVCGIREYCWYDFDDSSSKFFSDSSSEKKQKQKQKQQHRPSLSLLCKIPDGDLPYAFSSVAVGSRIYLIGGTEHNTDPWSQFLEVYIPSSAVHIIDTNRHCCGRFREGIRMIGGKSLPIAVNVDGKIYVIGCSLPILPAQPWAEVFDPTEDRWCALPYPSDYVESRSAFTLNQHVVNEKNKTILLKFGGMAMCSFNVTTQSWEYDLDMPPLDQFKSMGRHVIVDDVLYMFYSQERQLYAYKLTSSSSSSESIKKVKGLEAATKSMIHKHDPNHMCPVFLFHLGNLHLCLVWSVPDFTSSDKAGDGLHINCLKFRVEEERDGSFSAVVVDQLDPYFVPDALFIFDCLMIKRTPLSSDSLVPAGLQDLLQPYDPFCSIGLSVVQKATPRKNVASQATRHARRIYVGGLPSLTNNKAIEMLFNNYIKSSGDSGAVVDVYVDQRNFAIVEFSSVEEAKNAIELGAVSFEGEQLKIRRPTDYNRALDLAQSKTQLLAAQVHVEMS